MIRHICYVSGTRADFGLMRSTLLRLHKQSGIKLSICVTAMHLAPEYGNTVQEIEAAGLNIIGRIPVNLEPTTGKTMALAIGNELIGMTQLFAEYTPDLVLLLGDRGEMLAGALAAIHLNIPVAHIHGGERSGTVDELVRHAISKLSHYHFVATEDSRQRLIKMGEWPDKVFVTGAPGLDGIQDYIQFSRAQLCQQVGFTENKPLVLLVFHPVVQEIDNIGIQVEQILAAAFALSVQIICLLPNADAGGSVIRTVIQQYKQHPDLRIYVHMPRAEYFSWLAHVDFMLGNSSSGIIEAASFNIPVINVGSRQNFRERSANIIDIEPNKEAIIATIQRVLTSPKQQYQNVYGDGRAGERITKLLAQLPIDKSLLTKANAY